MAAEEKARETSLPYVLKSFDFAYIGICMPHILVYSSIAHADGTYGSVTGALYYLAVALSMAFIVVLAIKRGGLKGIARFDIPLAIIQAIATALLVIVPVPSLWFEFGFALLAGLCAGWMYLRWAPFYAELEITDAIASIFMAMAFGSLAKMPLELLPDAPAGVLLAFLPFLSVYLVRRAIRLQPPCTSKPRFFNDGTIASLPLKLLVGIVVYSFIMGLMRSMPMQLATDVAPWILSIGQHIPEMLIAIAVLWWVFVRRGLLHLSNLWRTILVLTAAGLFFMPVASADWALWSTVLVFIAQTLLCMLFWAMMADIARHTRISCYAVFGCGWGTYAVSVAAGELLGWLVPQSSLPTVFTVLAFALTLVSAYVFNESSFSERRIFADLDMPTPEQSAFAGIEEQCRALGEKHALTPREIEVLQMLCMGRSKSYIAETLFISENTVRSHSKHIYQKLDVHSKQEILDLLSSM